MMCLLVSVYDTFTIKVTCQKGFSVVIYTYQFFFAEVWVINMKTILIAIDSHLQSQQLIQHLSDRFCVVSCNNGEDAVALANQLQPDVIVVDLFLSAIDGVSLLEIIYQSGLRPRVVAISPYLSEYVISALERMQVNCLLRSSCGTEHLVSRILDVANWSNTSSSREDIDHILSVLGFKMNTSGYRITRLALELYTQHPQQAITNSLYPAVADACGGTATQVEKAIRDSIAGAWKGRNDKVWSAYFAIGKNGKVSKPSNGDFLARIGYCLCQEDSYPSKRKVC